MNEKLRQVAWLEPHPDVIQLIKKMSEQIPEANVSIFKTNQALQAYLKKTQPHLVLTHIGTDMTRQQGLDALAAIREHHPALPVIVVTGHPELTSEELTNKGAVAVVKKPFKVKETIELIRKHMG